MAFNPSWDDVRILFRRFFISYKADSKQERQMLTSLSDLDILYHRQVLGFLSLPKILNVH